MSDWLYVTLLGIVQGIAEFLPVSSSGHLTLLNELFGFGERDIMPLVVVMHAGSLVAIVAIYFRELWKFLKPGRLHLLFMLILATIPAGVAGVLIHHLKWDEKYFTDLLFVGFGFLITGALLRLTGKSKLIARSEGADGAELENISLRQALIVGFAQMFAIAPGISRSGSTISAGVLCGIRREAAATFSFLLAIPVIGGAVLVKLLGSLKKTAAPAADSMEFGPILLGFAVSMVVSFAALTLLLKIIRKGRLYCFSWYMLALGAVVTLWQLSKVMR